MTFNYGGLEVLTKNQIITLYDYCRYFQRQARRLADEAAKSRSLGAELQGAIVREQTRREKELTRLEKALGDEIEAINEEVKPGCKRETESTQGGRYRPKREDEAHPRKEKSRGRQEERQATQGTASGAHHEAKARPTAKDRRDRIVTYPQRRYVGESPQIARKVNKC